MEFNLMIGMTAESSLEVGEKDTAASFGSGGVKVFATPLMIGLMENAALSSVDPFLPEGFATVGLSVEVSHLAATPIGMTVTAKARLEAIEGKKLIFKVEAFDDMEKIGEGTHQRYIIQLDKFLAKAAKKSAESI